MRSHSGSRHATQSNSSPYIVRTPDSGSSPILCVYRISTYPSPMKESSVRRRSRGLKDVNARSWCYLLNVNCLGFFKIGYKGTTNFAIMQEFLVFFAFYWISHFLCGEKNKKKNAIAFFFRSATRTRTGVYGVRGRCPRPLDDSTQSGLPLNGRSGLCPKGHKNALHSKPGAKLLLFFDIRKFFWKKMHFYPHFFW